MSSYFLNLCLYSRWDKHHLSLIQSFSSNTETPGWTKILMISNRWVFKPNKMFIPSPLSLREHYGKRPIRKTERTAVKCHLLGKTLALWSMNQYWAGIITYSSVVQLGIWDGDISSIYCIGLFWLFWLLRFIWKLKYFLSVSVGNCIGILWCLHWISKLVW